MKEITQDAEFRSVVEESKVSVVDFFTSWCGPCKFVTPVLEAINKDYDAGDHKDVVKFFKVDCDKMSDLADEFNIQSVPTIILFVKGSKKVEFLVGNRPKDEFKKFIDKAIETAEKEAESDVPDAEAPSENKEA